MTEGSRKEASRLMLRPGAEASLRHTSDQELHTDAEETVITAGLTTRQYVIDIWKYRELLLFLAWREILVRYKQTVIGIAWAVIRPALMIFVLVIVFEKLGKMPSGGVPYPLLVLCGLLPWQFLSNALASSGDSLVGNAALVSKVYFPRLLIPAASISAGLVEFLISLALLVALLIWYKWLPPPTIIWLPCFLLLAIVIAFGAGIWAAALVVQYRDVRFMIPFVVQFGLYLSPVGFSSTVIPEKYELLYALNPMVGVIDGFRASILGGEHMVRAYSLTLSVLGAMVLVIAGLAYFRRTDRRLADMI